MCAVLFTVLLITGAHYGHFDPTGSAVTVLVMFVIALLYMRRYYNRRFALKLYLARFFLITNSYRRQPRQRVNHCDDR